MKLARSFRLLAFAFVLAAGLCLAGGPSPSHAQPGCGGCRGGTLDMATSSCPGAHTNCTECTVCAK